MNAENVKGVITAPSQQHVSVKMKPSVVFMKPRAAHTTEQNCRNGYLGSYLDVINHLNLGGYYVAPA
jgi:hypothetical protein